MPLYSYVCDVCGTEIEEMLKMSEGESEMIFPCDKCEEDTKHKKQLGTPAIDLRGEGWADTGYGYPTTTCEANTKNKRNRIRGKEMNPLMKYAGKGMTKKD